MSRPDPRTRPTLADAIAQTRALLERYDADDVRVTCRECGDEFELSDDETICERCQREEDDE